MAQTKDRPLGKHSSPPKGKVYWSAWIGETQIAKWTLNKEKVYKKLKNLQDNGSQITVKVQIKGKVFFEEPKVDLIATKNGLLYINDRMVDLPSADQLARAFGFQHAEQLVRALEKEQNENRNQEKTHE